MDDAEYVVLARSIACTQDYGLINAPGVPQPTRYPFGFPLLASPLTKWFPLHLEYIKLISLLATLLNTLLLFYGWIYLSQAQSYWWGLLVAALYATSPLVIGHTRMVMTEPVFTTFALLSLILTEKCSRNSRCHPLILWLLGLVITYACYIRTIGIVLGVVVVGRLFLFGPRKKALLKLGHLFLGSTVLTLMIVVFTPIELPDLLPTTYIQQFTTTQSGQPDRVEIAWLARLFSACSEYTQQHLREALLPIGGGLRELELGSRLGTPNLPLITGVGLTGLVLSGGVVSFSKKTLFPSIYMFQLLYLGVLLVWPFRGARFLYPLQPFLFYQLLYGLEFVGKMLQRVKWLLPLCRQRLPQMIVGSSALVILVVGMFRAFTDTHTSLEYTRDFRIGTYWIRDNSSPDALVMAQQPQSIYIYTDRQTIDLAQVNAVSELEHILQQQGVDYILIAPKLEWRLDGLLVYDDYTLTVFFPLIRQLADRGYLQLVFISEEDLVRVYQVIQ